MKTLFVELLHILQQKAFKISLWRVFGLLRCSWFLYLHWWKVSAGWMQKGSFTVFFHHEKLPLPKPSPLTHFFYRWRTRVFGKGKRRFKRFGNSQHQFLWRLFLRAWIALLTCMHGKATLQRTRFSSTAFFNLYMVKDTSFTSSRFLNFKNGGFSYLRNAVSSLFWRFWCFSVWTLLLRRKYVFLRTRQERLLWYHQVQKSVWKGLSWQ